MYTNGVNSLSIDCILGPDRKWWFQPKEVNSVAIFFNTDTTKLESDIVSKQGLVWVGLIPHFYGNHCHP